jgi:hypothetical protein
MADRGTRQRGPVMEVWVDGFTGEVRGVNRGW